MVVILGQMHIVVGRDCAQPMLKGCQFEICIYNNDDSSSSHSGPINTTFNTSAEMAHIICSSTYRVSVVKLKYRRQFRSAVGSYREFVVILSLVNLVQP